MKIMNVVMLTGAVVTLSLSGVVQATDPATERELFHDIYKELVETNTSHSAGDNTLAARRMEKRLRDAGFTEAEVQVVEPFPKKGNLLLRFKGDGTRRPILLLAHIDVVEAKREEWNTDPFTLIEMDGYFTALQRHSAPTCVTTMLNAGHAENALAQTARATVNCRVLPRDDLAEVDQKIRELVGNSTIEVKQTTVPIKSPPSPLTATILEPVEQISAAMWPGVPLIPTMGTGATDSLFCGTSVFPCMASPASSLMSMMFMRMASMNGWSKRGSTTDVSFSIG